MSTYEPNSYWREVGRMEPGIMDLKHPQGRGRTKRNILLQEDLLPLIIGALKPERVLEVGCGFGRMSRRVRSVPSIKVYDAIDISPDRIKTAQRNVSGVNFQTGDFMKAEFSGQYDVVFACEVLMHIPPSALSEFVGKMAHLSSGYVVNLDYWTKTDWQKLAGHNFNHPYGPRYYELGALSVMQTPLRAKRALWTEDYHQSIFVADFR